MLSRNPPYVAVNGLACFPDHLDQCQWYFLPMGPKIVTRIADDGKEVPAFSLVRFRSDDGLTGGLLSFDVSLSVDEETLKDAARQISSTLNLPGDVRLAPVPLEDGAVKLVALGAETPAEGTTVPDSAFVEKIIHAAKPSLYGDNVAAFSVVLDAEGATLVDRTLDGELLPIGVVYELSYLGLRPAYQVTLSVDWDRVQEHFDETFGVDSVFFSSQIEETLDKLCDERAIVIEADTFLPEDDAGRTVIGNRDRAIAAVYQMITDAFFTSALPQKPPPDGWDKAKELIEEGGRIAVTGGWGVFGGFTYNRTRHTQIDRKRLDVRFSERVAVLDTIYPQGHLSGVMDAIEASGRPRTDFVRDVELSDPWFDDREVRIVSRATYGFISSITVDLDYGSDVQTFLFDEQTAEKQAKWLNKLTSSGAALAPVDATVTYHLIAATGYRLPAQVSSKETVLGEVLEIRPDDAFRVITVPIHADGIPWERWSHVEVHVRYEDADHGLEEEMTFDLTEGAPFASWALFVMDPEKTAFAYRLVFHGNGRPDSAFDWQTTDDGELRIDDPYPAKLALSVTPSVSWREIDRILVDLVYEDESAGLRIGDSFEFTSSDSASRRFVVDLDDPNLRRVEYQATFLYVDGRQHSLPLSSTAQPRLVLSPTVRPTQAVLVSVEPMPAVKEVVVEFAPPGSTDAVAQLSFGPATPTQSYEFSWDSTPSYRYRSTHRFTNGMKRVSSWKDGSLTTLSISGK